MPVLDNRFQSLLEARRLRWPHLESLSDPETFDQGLPGYIEHFFLENFRLFPRLATEWTGHAVPILHRQSTDGAVKLDMALLNNIDTLIIISFDSLRTRQAPSSDEVAAVRAFVDTPGKVLFVCPHHNIGDIDDLSAEESFARQIVEHHHHGDIGAPAQQLFSGFAVALTEGLEVPIKNRFGLRPARAASPAPFVIAAQDRLHLMDGVTLFNGHPHVPHLERSGESQQKLEVLVSQRIDPTAKEHPFAATGRDHFDAVLQSRPGVFQGCLFVTDAFMWNSTAAPREDQNRFWHNVVTMEQ